MDGNGELALEICSIRRTHKIKSGRSGVVYENVDMKSKHMNFRTHNQPPPIE